MIGRRALLAAVAVSAMGLSSARAAEPLGLRPAGLKPAASSVEAGLWGESDQAEAYVRNSAELDTDPALIAYARQVVCRIAADYCPEMRVYVLDRPFFQATAAPNGYVEVWSGLMLRAQTEDELAYVLGHEVSHFARNHSLERMRVHKTTANVVLALQVGVTVGAAVAMANTASTGAPDASQSIDSISRAAQSLNNLIYLAGLARYSDFSRDNETEADALGFQRASAAGYSPGAGPRLWTAMVAETQASDFQTVRKSEARASVFSSHPITADRIAALRAMNGGAPETAEVAAQRAYRARIRSHLGPWLKDDLRRRDYGQTLYLIDRLEEIQEDMGVLEFYRGETLRQRRKAGDADAALKAYQAATGHPDAPAAAWRELGDGLKRQGDRSGAAVALQTYLERAPSAQDRWLVEATLKTLNTAGTP